MRPYLIGEYYNIFNVSGSNKVVWSNNYKSGGPLTWYQTNISKPSLTAGSALLLSGIGLNRGHFFLNGYDLGHYWMILRNDGSNVPTQTYYSIPQDLFIEGDQNLFTISAVLPVQDISKIDFVIAQMVPGTGASDSGVQVCQI